MGSDSEVEKTQQKEKERKKMLAVAPIAKPLAGKKLSKKTLKLVRRGIPFLYIHSTLFKYIRKFMVFLRPRARYSGIFVIDVMDVWWFKYFGEIVDCLSFE